MHITLPVMVRLNNTCEDGSCWAAVRAEATKSEKSPFMFSLMASVGQVNVSHH